MKFFTLIKGEKVHLSPEKKIVPAKELSTLIAASELLKKTQSQSLEYRQEVAKECEVLKEEAQKAGFDEGLQQWNDQIGALAKEVGNVRKDMEKALVPLALTAIKKIVGHALEIEPETIVDIIATSLKSVSQHHKIHIYVNKGDLDVVEKKRNELKVIFEHLERLSISAREDVDEGGCIIETEVGIINATLENQLKALEKAFHALLQNTNKES